MDFLKAIKERHSVREFFSTPIDEKIKEQLESIVQDINKQCDLSFQLVVNEPQCFSKSPLNYGKIKGCVNYIAIVGDQSDKDDFNCGYYGQRLVLSAQCLGLNSCWIALTYSKNNCKAIIPQGKKLKMVIALGYGKTQGVPHKSKPISKICKDYYSQNTPLWFKNGVDTAMLSPTAMNQQKFSFNYLGENKVKAQKGLGFYSKVDLGIVCHDFEVGANLPIEWEIKL